MSPIEPFNTIEPIELIGGKSKKQRNKKTRKQGNKRSRKHSRKYSRK
jgi:hypothetical protein